MNNFTFPISTSGVRAKTSTIKAGSFRSQLTCSSTDALRCSYDMPSLLGRELSVRGLAAVGISR